jgi:hypothetical protein
VLPAVAQLRFDLISPPVLLNTTGGIGAFPFGSLCREDRAQMPVALSGSDTALSRLDRDERLTPRQSLSAKVHAIWGLTIPPDCR